MIETDADIYLAQPDESYQQAILEYRNEFVANDEVIHGSGGLDQVDTFDEWMQKIRNDQDPATVPEGRVPATEFLAIRKSDNRLIGVIQVRHELNDFLLKHGGHIGYSVRKSERRKGYATQMLQQVLDFCQNDLGLDRALITCDKDNRGSAKVIVLNGGVLESEFTADEGTVVQRYWISLK